MDEFLLCENPLEPKRIYILKNSYPRCLVECDFETKAETPDLENELIISENFSFIMADKEIENWQLTIVQFYEGIPEIDSTLYKDYKSNLENIWTWFNEYLKLDEKHMIDSERDEFLGSVN